MQRQNEKMYDKDKKRAIVIRNSVLGEFSVYGGVGVDYLSLCLLSEVEKRSLLK